MLLLHKAFTNVLLPILCQHQTDAGSFLSKLDSNWVSAIVALLAFILSIITYREQREKDRRSNEETEKLRQQTVRLEWYRDTIKPRLEGINQAFQAISNLRSEFNSADLSDQQKDDILKQYKKHIYGIREQHLESLLFIHPGTYQKLKKELDDLADTLTNVIVNDELKLTNDGVFEREIGIKVKSCQQRFYQMIYSYRGEE